ncbi:pentatricopeptide repeat-containing protein, partial [Tanacetum coccineum]
SGYMEEAMRVFNMILNECRNFITWTRILAAYVQNGRVDEARGLFEANEYWNCDIVDGYVQNGMVDEARRVFDEMPLKNSISWNVMIAGYLECKRIDVNQWVDPAVRAQPLRTKVPRGLGSNHREKINPPLATEVQLRRLQAIQKGSRPGISQLAMSSWKSSSWNTMITGFTQSGFIDIVRDLFDKILRRDCISWGAIISGYAHLGHNEEGLRLFVEMKRSGEKSNRYGLDLDEVSDKDIVSWNIIIVGYARHGFGQEALGVFESMKTSGVKPDQVTMVRVLSAYSHSRLVDRGTHYFYTMNCDYESAANSKHYTCMIDLLGRAGRLDDAQNLMKTMPFEPDAATWGALLGTSRIYGNTELGEKATEMVFLVEPDNAGVYVLLSNLYAASGRWADVGAMRLKMRDTRIKKVLGYS